jgi:hypothetical protein
MPEVRHRASHRALLSWARSPRIKHAALDAIMVPSARDASFVVHAADLAVRLGCPLIVLASRSAVAQEVVDVLPRLKPGQLFVIDFPADLPSEFPTFQTSKLLQQRRLDRATDVSAKRNVGLALARMAGLNRVLFLDDDMRIPYPADLRSAAGMLDVHDAVGLRLDGFPDNSVVCHANRETGGFQDTFVGGGALVIAADRVSSFFPDVYNEDWFFLLDESRMRPVTLTGRAIQRKYDPFASERRARIEELGDVLAEGIFGMLDGGGFISHADAAYWQSFIEQRRRFIDKTLRRVERVKIRDRKRRLRMLRSLLAARDQLTRFVTPDLCVEYLEAWKQDLEVWRTYLEDLTPTGSIAKAIDALGLPYRTPARAATTVSIRALPAWPNPVKVINHPSLRVVPQRVVTGRPVLTRMAAAAVAALFVLGVVLP